eukprot:TRINITY_DN2269_c1_g1_i2.p1 TRINITY_DN2269_c1_g1~~TRINITY_DN2269_c1_g1_i2.p1  ORF type:complete len:437 (+),score=94.96 TRINITY_DN2269_c1_g1_i2:46-1356(+)
MSSSSSSSPRHALVVGCGISGPVMGLFLKKIGITCEIFESDAVPRDGEGGAVSLTENSLSVFDTLGVRDLILPYAMATKSMSFNEYRGRHIATMEQNANMFLRADLCRVLREEGMSQGINVHFGKRLLSVKEEADKVTALFEDGSSFSGDFLLGCDGIFSRTRRSVFPDAAPPAYTQSCGTGGFLKLAPPPPTTQQQQTASSSLTSPIPSSSSASHPLSLPSTNGEMKAYFGLRAFFAYQVLDDGTLGWFCNWSEPSPPADWRTVQDFDQGECFHFLMDLFKGDIPLINDIISNAQQQNQKLAKYHVYDLADLPVWHKGRVCLVGDSAHATVPHAGQGASLAIEDTIVLAKCLRDIPDLEGAFRLFQDIRFARCRRVVATGRRSGGHKTASNMFSRWLRDTLVPIFMKGVKTEMEKHYAYRIDWEQHASATPHDSV